MYHERWEERVTRLRTSAWEANRSGGGGVAGIHVMSSCLDPHYLNLST